MKARLGILIAALVLSFLNAEQSYAAPRYSFTTATASGISGPTQAQVNSAYSGTALAGLVTITTQGIQEWTVPTTGVYTIEFAGASGGYTPGALGGKGRIIKVQATLTAGNVLKILVGQEGGRFYFTTGYAGGGGGGTFIYNVTSSSFIGVAGGGGGAAQGNSQYISTQPGVDAALYSSTSGTAGTSYAGSWDGAQNGGTSGSAGTAALGGGSGAGINGNGSAGSFAGGGGGISFANGGTGGANRMQGSTATTNVAGGFGGGAGAGIYATYDMVGGGGGGYSGGGGSGTRVGAGGGGGNFYTGTYISNGLNTGNGFVTIQMVGAPTIALSLAGSVNTVSKGSAIAISALIDDGGRITFFADNKRIPNCINVAVSAGTITCTWKPPVQRAVTLRAILTQSGAEVARSELNVSAKKRTGTR